MSARDNLVNSALAAAVAEIATLPICTVKTNYQNGKFGSIASTVKHMYVGGGVSAFYYASAPALVSQMLTTGLRFTFYRKLADYSNNKFLNGLVGGVAASLIVHPFDVVKVHWQMKTPFLPVLKEAGAGVFYRGYSKTFSKACVASTLFLPLYDYAREWTRDPTAAALCSSTISTTLMHPIDYLKTRHVYGLPYWSGCNPRTYYRGLTLNLARVVPHFAIMMTTIEWLSRR